MSNRGKKPDEVEFNSTVGKNIRYLRKLNKLTQSEVADAIGVACQQVSKYEKGMNGLHSYSLYKVAHRVFNVSMDVLSDPKMITKYEGFRSDREMQRIEIELLGESKFDQVKTESQQAESYIQYNENLNAKKKGSHDIN